MRAAIISERGVPPVVGEFREPEACDGAVLITVETAGLGVEYPCVIRGEGVGRTADGQRVYFGERALLPFGAWAERTVVPSEEVWPVPDHIDDKTAISMGIAAPCRASAPASVLPRIAARSGSGCWRLRPRPRWSSTMWTSPSRTRLAPGLRKSAARTPRSRRGCQADCAKARSSD